jgi:hypothetical protein
MSEFRHSRQGGHSGMSAHVRYSRHFRVRAFVTTIIGAVGFFSFLGIATLWFGLK